MNLGIRGGLLREHGVTGGYMGIGCRPAFRALKTTVRYMSVEKNRCV
jgi:hypothetical protein